MRGLWVSGLVWVWGATGAIALSPTNLIDSQSIQYSCPEIIYESDLERVIQDAENSRVLGNIDTSLSLLECAWINNHEIQNTKLKIKILEIRGDIHGSLGHFDLALVDFEMILKLANITKNKEMEALSLGRIGWIYLARNQHKLAQIVFQDSIRIYREIQVIDKQISPLLGMAWSDENFNSQMNYLQQALEIGQQLQDHTLSGMILNAMGEFELNSDHLQSATNHFKEAIENFQKAKESNANLLGQSLSFRGLGLAMQIANNLKDSELFLFQAIEIQEMAINRTTTNLQDDQNRSSLINQYSVSYGFLQNILVQQSKISLALEVADRSRARSLLSFLRSENQATNKPLTASEIQAIAQQQNGTIVHYSVVSNELYIWVVPPTGAIAFRKVPLPQAAGGVAQAAEDLRNSAVTLRLMSMRGDDRQLASFANQFRGEGDQVVTSNPTDLRQGYDLLIKPIADLLPTAPGSKLIIIPHRELAVVPFAALRDEEGKFLIDRYTLAFAPSVSVLAEAARRPKTSNGPALIVGNPNPMPDNLRPLPGSEKEAQAIAQTLNTKPLIGSQATESKVKEQIDQASLLHFATHGILPRTAAAGLDSWLALAPSGDEDGQLTISEIFDRNLKAQLAVLSACDTGRGAVSGEGVIGLARAFLKAGVPTVVASLWKVPDEPTALMMQIFYAERAAGKDAATALRVAMLKVKEQYPGPQNWAAFVAIGDTN